MAPVLSIIIFPASQKFLTEDAEVKSAIEQITNVEGLISSYHGPQLEEDGGKKGILISTWESPEKLTAFRDNSGAKFGALIASLSTGEVQRYEYVAVHKTPELAFGGKVTEISWGKAKDSGSAAALKDVIIKASKFTDVAGHPSAVGESADGTIVSVAGWESPEEHWALAKGPEASAILSEIMSYADITVIHAKLKKRV